MFQCIKKSKMKLPETGSGPWKTETKKKMEETGEL
jgi:hypothetical protein